VRAYHTPSHCTLPLYPPTIPSLNRQPLPIHRTIFLTMFNQVARLAVALLAAASSPSNAESLYPRGEISAEKFEPFSLKSVLHENPSMQLEQKYVLGHPNAEQKTFVEIFKSSGQSSGFSLAKRDSSSTSSSNKGPRVDLTPADCTSQVCYSGSFQGPSKTDCDVIVAAQLYNSTGSLTSAPGTYVLVYSGTCAVVFQNPIGKPQYIYTLDYNWASLGKIMVNLQKKCTSNPESLSIGGACKIDHYLKYNFRNVLISLQRYDDEGKK